MKLKTFNLDVRTGKPKRHLSVFEIKPIAEMLDENVSVVYVANIQPGGAAGNHYHQHKVEAFACLHGRVKVILEHAETKDHKEIYLSADPESDDFKGLIIEPNVAHTVVNDSDEIARLAVFANAEPRVEGDDFEYQLN